MPTGHKTSTQTSTDLEGAEAPLDSNIDGRLCTSECLAVLQVVIVFLGGSRLK